MRKLFITMIIAAGSLMYKDAAAQVGVSVGFNIGPVSVQLHKPANVVYDDFYYMPDVEAYYSVPERVYYYMDGDDWVSAPCLPGAYRDYTWRNVRHYEVRAEHPFRNHAYYRSRFGGYDRGYAYRVPQGNRPGRFNNYPSSPYDSNNDRGGYYNRPDARNYPNRDNWNNRGGRGDNNRPGNDNRGGGNHNWPDNNRGNDRGNYGQPNNGNQGRGGYNNGQGNYSQPSGQPNRGNRGDYNQQRFTNNNAAGTANRMMF